MGKIKKSQMGSKSPSKLSDAQEKVKIAEKLYKDNPSKVFKDAVDSSKARLSRAPKKRSGGKIVKKSSKKK